ncbi:TIGR02206 family membrane protein [Psychrobacillus sp. FJAT-51614]|uniref:TIGR02206 family membrane protein n=1 Tax=Psychrobacillus mangrovi TaxID=3117745 RepID=A0ABU8F2A9_9BACI
MEENIKNEFVMFSYEHILAIVVLIVSLIFLFMLKNKLSDPIKSSILFERLFALSLLMMEVAYHLVLIENGEWNLSESLPIHLCSFSLFFSIISLWTGNKRFYDFIFFAGFGGALQAVLTPSLEIGFPSFKFFQFFYIHAGIIATSFYILWVKKYNPTLKSLLKTMVYLNIMFPFIFVINIVIDGNYMFLREKTTNGSLLDFLGPYPWYILSLEIVALFMFLAILLIFRKWSWHSKGMT